MISLSKGTQQNLIYNWFATEEGITNLQSIVSNLLWDGETKALWKDENFVSS